MRPRMRIGVLSPVRRLAFTLLVLLVTAVVAPSARATTEEQRIAVRGSYFREASTRVIQPMIEARVNLPHGFDVAAHGLVDAISSASIAQGANTDEVFSENRYEGGLRVGRSFGPSALGDDTRLGVVTRYSHEPDYQSYTGGFDINHWVLDKTGLLFAGFAVSHDE